MLRYVSSLCITVSLHRIFSSKQHDVGILSNLVAVPPCGLYSSRSHLVLATHPLTDGHPHMDVILWESGILPTTSPRVLLWGFQGLFSLSSTMHMMLFHCHSECVVPPLWAVPYLVHPSSSYGHVSLTQKNLVHLSFLISSYFPWKIIQSSSLWPQTIHDTSVLVSKSSSQSFSHANNWENLYKFDIHFIHRHKCGFLVIRVPTWPIFSTTLQTQILSFSFETLE